MDKKTTLYDITGQESGIVVYDDNEVIVCNWAQESSYGGLPRLGPAGGIIVWPGELKVTAKWTVEDVRDALPGKLIVDGETYGYEGMDVLYDLNGDIPALWGYQADTPNAADPLTDKNGNLLPTPGTVYVINDNIIVIAPDDWC